MHPLLLSLALTTPLLFLPITHAHPAQRPLSPSSYELSNPDSLSQLSNIPSLPQLSMNPLSIPPLGFGTWNLHPANASEAVAVAIETGYRHIDCAAAYGNEKEVGRGIAEGMRRAGVGRGDLWVTSKLWNDHHAPDLVGKALDQTVEDLGLDYLDLYLMHWPVASSSSGNKIDYLDTWHALTTLLHTTGTPKTHHLGISNFSPPQLTRLLLSTPHPPSVHQMELHPYLPQPAWLHYHSAHHIHVTAYSPLANTNPTYHSSSPDPNSHTTTDPPLLLSNPTVKAIADKRNCTPAQVCLQWGLSRGTSVVPKSAHAGRIRENFGAAACALEYEDFRGLAGLGAWETRFNNPSEGWGVRLYEGLDVV